MEMAFTHPDEIMDTIETMLLKMVKEQYPHKKLLHGKIQRIPYQEAMEKYGTDKPDIRF